MFLVLDGHSLIHRAYHAPGADLRSRRGIPTKATYTVLKQVIKMLDKFNPDFFVVAMDSSKADLRRKEWYAPYKENRAKPKDDDLKIEIINIYKLFKLLNIPCFSVKGWEADDIIATLAYSVAKIMPVTVVSRDKDLYQLFSYDGAVLLYDHMEERYISPDEAVEKFGVDDPKKFIEYQAMIGDSTDNVPGVPGIGPVAARKILAEADTAEQWVMYASLNPKNNGIIAKFRKGDYKLMKKLVTLATDVELPAMDFQYNGLDFEAARPFLKQLGFKRWSK